MKRWPVWSGRGKANSPSWFLYELGAGLDAVGIQLVARYRQYPADGREGVNMGHRCSGLPEFKQGNHRSSGVIMENKNFTWNQNGPAPYSRRHSLKKLDVIEQYVQLYLKTLASNPRIDRITLYLVDTFCGGGTYRNPTNRQIELGSPLRLLHAVRATEAELNQKRRKQFRIHAKFSSATLPKIMSIS